jgi:hypothetical protein
VDFTETGGSYCWNRGYRFVVGAWYKWDEILWFIAWITLLIGEL